MRSRILAGLLLLLLGLGLLYVLRHVLVQLIVLVLGFIGVVVALALIAGGLGLILWPRGRR